MRYRNLQELISHSASSRQYFLSLPVSVQQTLHERDQFIHSAADLHAHVHAARQYEHAVKNSGMF